MIVSIGFSTSQWWVSRLIRDATRAPVSHTYIVFDDPASPFGHEVYEAAWCGFRMSTRAKLTSGSTTIFKEIAVPLEPLAALALCRAWLETPYDYPGLIGEAPVQLGKLFGQRWPNVSASPHHMFCSEAATYLLQQAPSPPAFAALVDKLTPRAVSPADLLGVLTQPLAGFLKTSGAP
jgi:hypothetical protein